MTELSRMKQRETIQKRYGPDHYANMAKKRWEKPGAKEAVGRDDKGKFMKKEKS